MLLVTSHPVPGHHNMTAEQPAPADPLKVIATRRSRTQEVLFVFLIVLPLLALLGFMYQQYLIVNRIEQERTHRNNLHNISLALVNYYGAYRGYFPPPSVNTTEDSPYSWRFPMLGYVDSGPLWRPQAPWNDPKMVRIQLPLYCFYPDPKTGLRTTTNILAITGPDSPIRDLQSVRTKPLFNLQELKDLPPDTYRNLIVFMEVFDSGVHWMEPVDLVVRDNQLTLRDQPFEIKIPDWARGFHVAFPDYATWLLDKKTPVDALIPLMKISTAGKYDRDKHLAPYILNKYPQR